MKLLSVRTTWLSSLLLLLLAGCGGGGGGELGAQPAASTRLVAGYVADGPIAGSRILLVDVTDGSVPNLCGASGRGRCETLSRENGYFYLNLEASTPLDRLRLTAGGGLDQSTGVDFTGLALQADLDLAVGSLSSLTISPLTTLLSHDRVVSGSPESARLRVGSWLGLDPAAALDDLPTTDVRLERVALLLTGLALEMKRVAPGSEPFQLLSSLIDPARPLISEGFQADAAVLAAALRLAAPQISQPLSEERIADLQALCGVLAAAPDGLPEVFVDQQLYQALKETLALKYAEDGTFDPSDPRFVLNGRELASAIRKAALAQNQLIPLNGVVPQRLVRYALFAYGLNAPTDFVAAPETFLASLDGSGDLPPLALNPKIAELAAISALHSVETPLLSRDLPGDDNLKRLTYYYRSDLSHLYQAEKIVGRVSDDLVNDAILLEIVKGKAAAGLFAEAEQVIETQIYQSQFKGRGYLELGYWLNRFGQPVEADRVLQLGHPIYRRYFDLVPPAKLGTQELMTVFRFAANFRKAGNILESQQIIEEMISLSAVNPSITLSGRLVVAARDYVELLLADAFVEEAQAQIEAMHRIANQTPVSTSTAGGVLFEHYRSRIFYLIVTATAYADLGDVAGVREVYLEIMALFGNDGLANLTANESWAWIPDLVDDLYRTGNAVEALALAERIPDSFTNYAGTVKSGLAYQADAYAVVATYEALSNGFAAALAVINAHFSAPEDKIDALTYFALNKNVEHVGLAFLNRGDLAQGVAALDEAGALLDGLTPGTDADLYKYVIQYGYTKLADLYYLAGGDAQALTLLERALEAKLRLSDPVLAVEAELDIARGYDILGDRAAVESRLASATSLALSSEAALAAESAAGVYRSLVEAHFELRSGAPVSPLVARMVLAAEDIYDNSRTYAGTTHDTTAKKEIAYLLAAGAYYARLGDRTAALGSLEQAKSVTLEIFVETTRMDQLAGDPESDIRLGVAGALAAAGFTDEAIALAQSDGFENSLGNVVFTSRNQALQKIAVVLTQQDAFPETDVASVDSDHDGLADFFSPAASAEDIAAANLLLDPDSDGDGLPDVEDLRPLWFDAPE